MGTNNLANLSSNAQMKQVREIFVHPNYVQGSFDHDIALLKTDPFTISDYVRPVCAPTMDMDSLFDNGTLCTTAGFGATTGNDHIQPFLNEVEVPVVEQEKCRDLYSTFPEYPVTDNMICLGYIEGGKGVCTGDGPSVSKVNDKYYMVGIPSWYAGCAQPGFPAVYTRMTAFEDWLEPIYEDRDPTRKDLECGRQVAPMEPGLRVVGGQPAQMGEWPWQAAIYVNNVFQCGASLLTPDWIVTSALCTPFLNDVSVYLIRMGILDLLKVHDNEQRVSVSAVYIHPNYTKPGNDWDIALLKLSSPFTITDYVRTICVPPSDMDDLYETGRNHTITGWGHTTEGESEYPPLRQVEVPVYDQDLCREAYAPEPVTENMFCAGYPEGGRDSCSGDGGGPVVTKAGEQWFLTGVVSWGNGCARPGYPGVNTRVSAFADWMEPIFTGGEPETRPSECSYNEFQCEDGWCVDYSRKCNDVRDEGCFYDTDEEFCDGHTIYFDPFFSRILDESSIIETFQTDSIDRCAQLCLNTTQYTCQAFNYKNHTCNIAGRDYKVVDSTDMDTTHFEMEKFPAPGTTITSLMGRLATPRWLPNSPPVTATDGLYIWILKPDITKANTISFQFSQIVHGDPATECQNPKTESFLVVRSGEEFDAPIVMQFCLNQVPETFEVRSPVVRLEFYSANADKYGFVANYNGYWYCDQNLDTAPGTISTPNYPEHYHNNAKCTTIITAPEGHSVVLTMIDFQLEYDDFLCLGDFDTLSVYNYDKNELIGVYCGTDIPDEFVSDGRSLSLYFKTDSTVTAKGYQASYYFQSKTGETTTPDRLTSTVKSTSAPSTMDPIRKELEQAEQRANSFMIATYALLGVLLPAIIVGTILVAYYSRRRRSDDKQENSTEGFYHQNSNNGNASTYMNATYTSEGVVTTPVPVNNNESGVL
ncbi:uncharacterized protein [Amphiura filiformis]|uniref:uncharacterized protein n=1 Tax=Amphiura filiformis TaxID=82378 RepID=UPI003B21AFB6